MDHRTTAPTSCPNTPKPSHSAQLSNYLISTSESDLGHAYWKVTDLNGRLVYKTSKELIQEEIVESIQDSSGQTQWTIHKPTRGWYLVLRSPVYTDPQTYIALQPMAGSNPSAQVQFSFRLRQTHLPGVAQTVADGVAKAEQVRAGSPSTVKKRSSSVALAPSTLSSPTEPVRVSELRHADLTLVLRPTADGAQDSVLKTLAGLFANQNRPFVCTHYAPSALPDPVLFEYTDERSLFGIHTCGRLALHADTADKVGMPSSFWLAVCLAYLGFRDDQEAYLAATEDIQ